MSVFIGSPYLLSPNTLIQAQYQAHNAIGWGDLSDENTGGDRVQTIPD